MNKSITLFTLLTSLLLVSNDSHAKTLEELLVEKGVITEDEAKGTKGPVLTMKGIEFSLGGELEFEYTDNEANGYNGHFSMDSFRLYPKAVTKGGIILKGELVSQRGADLQVEEMHATFPDALPGGTFLKIGKEDRFIKRSRKTETYPIAGTQFWRDDVEGIWIGGKSGDFYWDASFTNSFVLATKSTVEESVTYATKSDVVVFHDNRAKGTKSSKKEYGIGLGYKITVGETNVDARVFYFDGKVGEITDTKNKDIATKLGINSNSDRDILGARFTCNKERFTLIGEYIEASYGSLDTSVWYIEPSFKNSVDGYRYFQGYEVVLRYNESDPDVARDFNNPLTWGLEQTTIAFIASLDKTVKFKTEYNFVDEDNGGSEIDNDELLIQLEYKF